MTDWIGDLRNVWLLVVSVMTALVTVVAWGTRRASHEDLARVKGDLHQVELDLAGIKADATTHREALNRRLTAIESGIKRIEDHLLKGERQ